MRVYVASLVDLTIQKPGEPVNILTHCNAGWLATVDWGTALAPIYKAHDAGIPVVASGAKLVEIFSAEMLAGGFRKKYLRATSRLLALSAADAQ